MDAKVCNKASNSLQLFMLVGVATPVAPSTGICNPPTTCSCSVDCAPEDHGVHAGFHNAQPTSAASRLRHGVAEEAEGYQCT
jgi:hypothetical protein